MFEPSVPCLEPQYPLSSVERIKLDEANDSKRLLQMLHSTTPKTQYQMNVDVSSPSTVASSGMQSPQVHYNMGYSPPGRIHYGHQPHYHRHYGPHSPAKARHHTNYQGSPSHYSAMQSPTAGAHLNRMFQESPHSEMSNDLLRLIQPQRTPKSIPFIPHNAYSVDPITGGMILPMARDLIPQGLPVNRIPQGMWQCIQTSGNMNMHLNGMNSPEDEEEFGLCGMDRVLYTRSEAARRVACEEYNSICKAKTYDLTITMPVQVPYGTMVLDALSGEHYYGLVGENSTSEHSDHALFGRGLVARKTMSHKEGHDIDGNDDIPDFTASHKPSACDVWSSFLRIKLGVIYNVRQDQFRIVSENLKNWFSYLSFESPLDFICNGIYATNNTTGILQSPPIHSHGVKYVTHLKPKTPLDQSKFIKIRQRIKDFSNHLGFHFGGATCSPSHPHGNTNQASNDYQPLIGVELDVNLSSERVCNGLIQVEIRSYDAEDISSDLMDAIWSPVTDEKGEVVSYKNKTKDVIVSKVEATEIRLDHDRGHCVDPRWKNELVIARRIASHEAPGKDAVTHPERYARHIFCDYASPVAVTYRGKFVDLAEGEDKQFVTDHVLDGRLIKEKLQQSRFKREMSNYVRCQPQAGSYLQRTGSAMSPVNAPLPRPYIAPMPPIKSHSTNWNVNATEFKPSKPSRKNRPLHPNKKVSTTRGKKPYQKTQLPKKQGLEVTVDVLHKATAT